MKKQKLKKCRVCPTKFKPISTTQVVCGWKCAIELQNRQTAKKAEREAKEFRKETRRRKVAMKSRSKWLTEAQTACNAYIRERDKDEPCISCGTTKPDIQYCAGHYKTRGGHPELRFHPFNIRKQCNRHCNLALSGNIPEYRPNLIKKIGLKNVEWIEGKHEPQNLTIDDIAEIKEFYKNQLKLLKP